LSFDVGLFDPVAAHQQSKRRIIASAAVCLPMRGGARADGIAVVARRLRAAAGKNEDQHREGHQLGHLSLIIAQPTDNERLSTGHTPKVDH
jgi:hypothetical protein